MKVGRRTQRRTRTGARSRKRSRFGRYVDAIRDSRQDHIWFNSMVNRQEEEIKPRRAGRIQQALTRGISVMQVIAGQELSTMNGRKASTKLEVGEPINEKNMIKADTKF